MRPTVLACCIVEALGILLSAATGGATETRLETIRLPPGFRIAPYAIVGSCEPSVPCPGQPCTGSYATVTMTWLIE